MRINSRRIFPRVRKSVLIISLWCFIAKEMEYTRTTCKKAKLGSEKTENLDDPHGSLVDCRDRAPHQREHFEADRDCDEQNDRIDSAVVVGCSSGLCRIAHSTRVGSLVFGSENESTDLRPAFGNRRSERGGPIEGRIRHCHDSIESLASHGDNASSEFFLEQHLVGRKANLVQMQE